MNTTFNDADVLVGGRVTINQLEFSVGNVNFTYQELKGGWIFYKATLGSTVKYTALGQALSSSGEVTGIGIEDTSFKDNLADINPTAVGYLFLTKE